MRNWFSKNFIQLYISNASISSENSNLNENFLIYYEKRRNQLLHPQNLN
jgi:hypothetical protein